jgi:hypothetical protein
MALIKVAFSRAISEYAFLSKGIQLAEKRPFSHAFIMFYDPISKQTLIFQASHGMVHLISLDKFLESNILVKSYDLIVSEEEYQNVWKFIVKRLGTPYSKWSLFVLILMKAIGFKKFIKLDGDKAFICSELAAEFCKLKSIQIPENIDVVTPSDLDLMLSCAGLRMTDHVLGSYTNEPNL